MPAMSSTPQAPATRPASNVTLAAFAGSASRRCSKRAPGRRRCDERLRTLPDTAELRERLHAALGERDRLEPPERILRLAEDELAEAIADTYRDFAPRLNQALEAHLSRVTRGRYPRAYVGEDLSVSLEAPETSAPVPLESTSLGTQRLAQLVLRLELVRLLAPSAEPLPVLLDDPFAHLDRDRLADADLLSWRRSRPSASWSCSPLSPRRSRWRRRAPP